MRRPFSLRIARAVLALWFVVAIGDLPGLDACPMHDGVPVEAAGMHAHHGARHPGGDRHDAPPRGHGCLCLSGCTGAPALDVPPVFEAALLAATPVLARLPAHAESSVPTAEHRLPFANGPPAA